MCMTAYTRPKYIKATDADGKCRGMLFEVGKEYETPVYGKRCNKSLCTSDVIHFVDDFDDLSDHYNCSHQSSTRFFEVLPLGVLLKDGNKCGSDKIRVVRELSKEEVDTLRQETLEFRMKDVVDKVNELATAAFDLYTRISRKENVTVDDFDALVDMASNVQCAIRVNFNDRILDEDKIVTHDGITLDPIPSIGITHHNSVLNRFVHNL